MNIAVNLIFVPVFGYYAAAVSTFIGFFVYFTLAYMGTRKLMRWNLPLLVYIRIIISAVIMAMVIMAVRFVTGGGMLSLCCMIGAGILAYVLALFFTGEIKREVKAIINVLRK